MVVLEGLWKLVPKLVTSLCSAFVWHVGKGARRAEDTEVLLIDSFRFPCVIYTQTLPFCLVWIPEQETSSWLGHCVQSHAMWQKFQE